MFGPTLFDLAAIVSLAPTSSLVDPSHFPDKQFSIVIKPLSYNKFVENNYKKSTSKVSASTNIAFLWFWLNTFVFYTKSLQVQKVFLPLAALIYEEHEFSFSKLLLSHLYSSLAETVNSFQNHNDVASVKGLL